MSENPYAPPQAPVLDARELEPPVQKPAQVVLAVRLLWGTLAIGVVNSGLQWPRLSEAMPVGQILAIQVFTFAILGWLTIKISNGRNWARITFLVLFLIGLPGGVLQVTATFGYSLLAGLLSVVQILMQAIALYLVFTEPGRSWYRRHKA